MTRRSHRDQPGQAAEPDAPASEPNTGDVSGEALPPLEPDETTVYVGTVHELEGLAGAESALGGRAEVMAVGAEREIYLTTRVSERFGPRGAFVPLTDAEAADAPEGLLVRPTLEQLAARP